jgi:hypothetical protein
LQQQKAANSGTGPGSMNAAVGHEEIASDIMKLQESVSKRSESPENTEKVGLLPSGPDP